MFCNGCTDLRYVEAAAAPGYIKGCRGRRGGLGGLGREWGEGKARGGGETSFKGVREKEVEKHGQKKDSRTTGKLDQQLHGYHNDKAQPGRSRNTDVCSVSARTFSSDSFEGS